MPVPFMVDQTRPVYIVNDASDPAQQAIPVSTIDPWNPNQQADTAANDSDKSFTVPAGAIWQILWIWVEFAATGTVGNRQLVVEIQDAGSNVVAQIRAGAVQAASLTRKYLFAPGMMDLTTFRDTDFLATPIPPGLLLGAGWKVRVYDKTAVAAAADDMTVRIGHAERSA